MNLLFFEKRRVLLERTYKFPTSNDTITEWREEEPLEAVFVANSDLEGD